MEDIDQTTKIQFVIRTVIRLIVKSVLQMKPIIFMYDSYNA